jgi:hypothetical protein
MNLFNRLFNLFAKNEDHPYSDDYIRGKCSNIPMPPVAPPKGLTPEPSCLARGIAKAWIDDRANWTIERSRSEYISSWNVKLIHVLLGTTITFNEDDSTLLWGLEVLINGERMLYEYHYIKHVIDAIRLNAYPELKKRMDAAAREDAERARNIKAIEALGCPAQEDLS